MIKMMEKYTDHLEDLVAERTNQLEEEKAKTDELLYRMLPKYVVLSLVFNISLKVDLKIKNSLYENEFSQKRVKPFN